jgi:hypothetical protein
VKPPPEIEVQLLPARGSGGQGAAPDFAAAGSAAARAGDDAHLDRLPVGRAGREGELQAGGAGPGNDQVARRPRCSEQRRPAVGPDLDQPGGGERPGEGLGRRDATGQLDAQRPDMKPVPGAGVDQEAFDPAAPLRHIGQRKREAQRSIREHRGVLRLAQEFAEDRAPGTGLGIRASRAI